MAISLGDEIVVSQEMAEAMVDHGLTGFSLKPARHRSGKFNGSLKLESVPAGRQLLAERALHEAQWEAFASNRLKVFDALDQIIDLNIEGEQLVRQGVGQMSSIQAMGHLDVFGQYQHKRTTAGYGDGPAAMHRLSTACGKRCSKDGINEIDAALAEIFLPSKESAGCAPIERSSFLSWRGRRVLCLFALAALFVIDIGGFVLSSRRAAAKRGSFVSTFPPAHL